MVKSKVNKSAAVRALLKNQPNIQAGAAVDRLAAQGIHVSANLIYSIRSELNNGNDKVPSYPSNKYADVTPRLSQPAIPQPPRPPVVPPQAPGSIAGLVFRIDALAGEVGGYNNLGELVNTLTAIRVK